MPPKPMVISVDNNGGQGAWLRLFIEVSAPLHHSDWLLPAGSPAHRSACKEVDLAPQNALSHWGIQLYDRNWVHSLASTNSWRRAC